MIQIDCILCVLAAADCSQGLFSICHDYSSTLPFKCLQIWICVSVSVSSSGTKCVTQFASGFKMIDWLFEFALSRNEDWGPVTIAQLHFTVHERTGSWNTFLTSSLWHIQLCTHYYWLKHSSSLFLGRLRKRDLTWQIQFILKSTYCEMTSDLVAGGKIKLKSRSVYEWFLLEPIKVVCGNADQIELLRCTGDVQVTTVTVFALSDAMQQSNPRAMAQSKTRKDMWMEVMGKEEEVKASNCPYPVTE